MKLRGRAGLQRKQQGIVLLVAIVVVIAMTLGAYAMLRSAGNSLAISGNISFQQNATSVADLGTEAARAWALNELTTGGAGGAINGSVLDADQTDEGYFASWDAGFDPTAAAAWDDSVELALTADQQRDLGVVGVRYVIHRMCSQVGSATSAGQQCVVPEGICINDVGANASQALNDCALQPFFRVTARVDGPRNTRSYTQVLLFF
jgi:type IV pilus assembly protein PilX